MNSIVLELQAELLQEECNVLIALRKAHVIAAKLKLSEFDCWISNELNGYHCPVSELPAYRTIHGSCVARNPYQGWIPVGFHDAEIAEYCTKSPLSEGIASIQDIYDSSEGTELYVRYPHAIEEIIIKGMDFELPVALQVNTNQIKAILEAVKNCLLEWTLKLEEQGILGEGMVFTAMEKEKATEILQPINNYYGNVINGSVSGSQLVSGQTVSVFNGISEQDIEKVRKSIEAEIINPETKETAMELLESIHDDIAEQKKPHRIKAAVQAFGSFLAGVGASMTAEVVMQWLPKLM